ncbi:MULTISPECIES: hypothetical protein [unclassified Variovorax]|uniref:hypothetical protein n=1 Tax=unclassified Variovorax TaxID=663243 RepID=UPI0008384ED0|nr:MULTISPECIES: hypothetical protein [unclassified Variovorax]VTV17469.1 hypothetical protein WDL1P1_00411 [Variovorax sp. WDL1]
MPFHSQAHKLRFGEGELVGVELERETSSPVDNFAETFGMGSNMPSGMRRGMALMEAERIFEVVTNGLSLLGAIRVARPQAPRPSAAIPA